MEKEWAYSQYVFPFTACFISSALPCAVLSFQERQDLYLSSENDVNMELAGGDDAWEDKNSADVTWMLAMPPPGEEGFFISHAGSESTLQQIFVNSLSSRYASLSLSTLQNLTDTCSANVMISKHDRSVLSIVCNNGEHSYQISLMHLFHSRPMVHVFQIGRASCRERVC